MMNCQNILSLSSHWMIGSFRDPQVYARPQIADMMDQAIAEGCSADEAEARAMEQVKKLGGELLGDWAGEKQQRSVAESRRKNPSAIKHIKKVKWFTTFRAGRGDGTIAAAGAGAGGVAALLPKRRSAASGLFAPAAAGTGGLWCGKRLLPAPPSDEGHYRIEVPDSTGTPTNFRIRTENKDSPCPVARR